MRWLVAVLAASMIVAAAGCGGDDNNKTTNTSSGQTTTPSKGGTSGTLQVSETDFKLNPANPTVKKPGIVEIKATNDGQVEHSLEVEGPNGEAKLAKTLPPGESGTLKVDLSKPGKYEWYCPIDDHKGMGMEGEITVEGSASGGSQTTGTNTTETNTTETNTTETNTTETNESGGSSGSSSGSGGGGGY